MVPLFERITPADRTCGICKRAMVRLLHVAGEWFACTACDAPWGGS